MHSYSVLPLMEDVPFCGQDSVVTILPARVVGKSNHQTGSFSEGHVTGGSSISRFVQMFFECCMAG